MIHEVTFAIAAILLACRMMPKRVPADFAVPGIAGAGERRSEVVEREERLLGFAQRLESSRGGADVDCGDAGGLAVLPLHGEGLEPGYQLAEYHAADAGAAAAPQRRSGSRRRWSWARGAVGR